MLAATTTPAALAAKRATSTIPIVFVMGADPIAVGLVDSLSRPSGNVTGVNNYMSDLGAKRLTLLRELVPLHHRQIDWLLALQPVGMGRPKALALAFLVCQARIVEPRLTLGSSIYTVRSLNCLYSKAGAAECLPRPVQIVHHAESLASWKCIRSDISSRSAMS